MKNNSTRETAPFLIRAYEARLNAIHAGASADFVASPEMRSRMMRAYQAGEACWMMADELTARSKGAALAKREEDEARTIHVGHLQSLGLKP